MSKPLPTSGEVRSVYVNQTDRFVVSLVVTYGTGDDINTPAEAVAAARGLVTEPGCADTVWHVYDRETGERFDIRQGDARQTRD
jgi:hypothetical protein